MVEKLVVEALVTVRLLLAVVNWKADEVAKALAPAPNGIELAWSPPEEEIPVPPYEVATAVPCQVPTAIVPIEVKLVKLVKVEVGVQVGEPFHIKKFP